MLVGSVRLACRSHFAELVMLPYFTPNLEPQDIVLEQTPADTTPKTYSATQFPHLKKQC